MSVNKEQRQQRPLRSSAGRWQERCSFWHTPVSPPGQRQAPFLPRLRLCLTGQVSRAHHRTSSFFLLLYRFSPFSHSRATGGGQGAERCLRGARAAPCQGHSPQPPWRAGGPRRGPAPPPPPGCGPPDGGGRRGGGETWPPGGPTPGFARLGRQRGVGAAPEGLSSEPPVGPVPAGRGLSAGRRRLPLGSAPRSAPEPLQREDGDGGSERRAGLRRPGGLGGYGSGNRAGGSDPTGARRAAVGMGRSRTVPGDLPLPLRPSALLLPRGGTGLGCGGDLCPAPGEKRGEWGGPLFPRPPSSGAAPLFLPAARPTEGLGAGRAQAEAARRGCSDPFPGAEVVTAPGARSSARGKRSSESSLPGALCLLPPFLSRSSLCGWGAPGQRPFSSRPRAVRGSGRRGCAEGPSGSLLPNSRLCEAVCETSTVRGYGRMQADSVCPPLPSLFRLVAYSVVGERGFAPRLSPTRSARGPGGAGGRQGAAVGEPGRSESSPCAPLRVTKRRV